MSAYASVPGKKSSKAKNRAPAGVDCLFPSVWICYTCALASDVAVWKALPRCRMMPNKSVFIGWCFSNIAGSHISRIFTLKLCFTIIMLFAHTIPLFKSTSFCERAYKLDTVKHFAIAIVQKKIPHRHIGYLLWILINIHFINDFIVFLSLSATLLTVMTVIH